MKTPTISLRHSHREWRQFAFDNTGRNPVLPAILTDNGVVVEFAHYIHEYQSKSSSWQISATFSVQLLLEYMEATKDRYPNPRKALMAFSEALFAGTVENYSDPSGLWWLPRAHAQANKIINHITHFTDWLAKRKEDESLQLNPWHRATQHEERLNCAAFEQRRSRALLGHLWRKKPQTGVSRAIRRRSYPINPNSAPKAFPDNKFDLLVFDGFKRRAKDGRGGINLRDVLITMLMHYGGLRMSEALSLWESDVSFEAGEVVVRVFHPEAGLAPEGNSQRSTYLLKEYGLLPRNQLSKERDKSFLGWKNPLITDTTKNCFEVFFFPHVTSFTFAKLWQKYHVTQRVRPDRSARHPYAFTSNRGEPYSHGAFRDAHRRAVKRIGLQSAKMLGTTPHGHRHSFGQRLKDAGAHPLLIMHAMHHASIESSQVYTGATDRQLREQMKELESQLNSKFRNSDASQPCGEKS